MDLSFNVLLQATINGFAQGWIFILMALGLTFVLSMMNILQLAHGEIYMIGAYLVYFFSVSQGFNFYFSILISMVVVAFFGLFLQKFLFRPVQDQILPPIMISIGLMLILTSVATTRFGLFERSLPALAEGSTVIFGAAVPRDRIIGVCIAIILLLVLYIFLKKTRYGQAMIAASQNREYALLRGIDTDQISALAFMVASALAVAGGALSGSILMIHPFMGTNALINGLVIIVIGGMGSIKGAVIGGMILGLITSIFTVMFNPALSSILPLVFVIIILLFRPRGLFGYGE